MYVSASTILLAVGFSMCIGIVFGVIPAQKASKKNADRCVTGRLTRGGVLDGERATNG